METRRVSEEQPNPSSTATINASKANSHIMKSNENLSRQMSSTQWLVVAFLLLTALGCQETIPSFWVNHHSISRGKEDFTEDEFFREIESLIAKHKIVCDVHDRESSDFIHDHFLPRLRAKLEQFPEVEKLVEIEIIEE